MAIRKPVVSIAGVLQELPAGDSIPGEVTIGIAAGNVMRVDQTRAYTDRTSSIDLSAALYHTLTDTKTDITAFQGTPNAVYNIKFSGGGKIINSAALNILQTAGDIITSANDTCKIRVKIDGVSSEVFDYQVANVTHLPDGTDLNSIQVTGVYNGAGLVNAPDGFWYFIEVFRHVHFGAGANEWVTQRATGMSGPNIGKTFIRSQYAPADWSAWQGLATVAQTQPKLPEGTDLNTVAVTGIYNGGGLLNAPDTNWYFIEVFRYVYFAEGSDEWLMQRATGMNGPNMGKTFVRSEYAPANWTAWQELATTSQIKQQLFHTQDQKPSGTHGGDSIVGWQTRTLNTVLTNEIAGASLANNIITLPAGTYYCEASAPAYESGMHKLALRDTADLVILAGTTQNAASFNLERSSISGRFTIGAPTGLKLDHIMTTAGATTGLGIAYDVGMPEIYADIKIWRVI